MWKLLRVGGIIPEDWTVDDNPRMPSDLQIGFTDMGCVPGNDAIIYKRREMKAWRFDMYSRLQGHVSRVNAWKRFLLESETATYTEAEDIESLDAGAPLIVAFTGKRQYAQLFDPPLRRVPAGLQATDSLPPGWPLQASQVWVLPSSSGRAVVPWNELTALYSELGKALKHSNGRT